MKGRSAVSPKKDPVRNRKSLDTKHLDGPRGCIFTGNDCRAALLEVTQCGEHASRKSVQPNL